MSYGTPVKDGITSPAAALAEWIWRKCRNHDPLRKRYGETDSPLNGRLEHQEGTNQTFYTAGGKRFKITIEEVGAEDESPSIHIPLLDSGDDMPPGLLAGDD